MFSAQILNHGSIEVHADDYQKSDKDTLCCPDPECTARMTYVQESEELATFYRAAHFRTLPHQKHVEGCVAHHEEKDFKQRIDTIKEAVSKGKKILLSLNDVETGYGLPSNLRVNFGSKSDPNYAHTELYAFEKENRGNFQSQSVKQIRTLMMMLYTIDKEGGPPAFNQVYFAWQGQVKTYQDFVCDDATHDKALFKELYGRAKDNGATHRFDAYNQVGAYGFPRLFEFQPSPTAINSKSDIVFGQQIIVNQDQKKGARLFLKYAIDIRKLDQETRARLLSGKPVRLLATPKVNYTHAKKAFEDFKGGATASVRLTWSVVGNHQIQIIDPDKKLGRPLPARPKNAQYVLL